MPVYRYDGKALCLGVANVPEPLPEKVARARQTELQKDPWTVLAKECLRCYLGRLGRYPPSRGTFVVLVVAARSMQQYSEARPLNFLVAVPASLAARSDDVHHVGCVNTLTEAALDGPVVDRAMAALKKVDLCGAGGAPKWLRQWPDGYEADFVAAHRQRLVAWEVTAQTIFMEGDKGKGRDRAPLLCDVRFVRERRADEAMPLGDLAKVYRDSQQAAERRGASAVAEQFADIYGGERALTINGSRGSEGTNREYAHADRRWRLAHEGGLGSVAKGARLEAEEDVYQEFKMVKLREGAGGAEWLLSRVATEVHKAACAFLNSLGGVLWVGVKDDGVVAALSIPASLRRCPLTPAPCLCCVPRS